MDQSSRIKVGLFVYEGTLTSSLYGLGELFTTANKLAHHRYGVHAKQLETSVWETIEGLAPKDLAPALIQAVPATRLNLVIVPPSMRNSADYRIPSQSTKWLQAQRAQGALLASVCTGAFVLGGAGLLNGKRVTTHWHLADRLQQCLPETTVDANEVMIDEGDLITTGAITSWMDLGLRIVLRCHGADVAVDLGRYYLIRTGGREQRSYRRFSPRLDHGDTQILKVQHWLRSRLGEPIGLADLARIAGLSKRTLQRRFEIATGCSPTAYLQRSRINQAADQILTTRDTVEEIAWKVGYEDQSAFRKVFKREFGLTPAAYRKQFQIP